MRLDKRGRPWGLAEKEVRKIPNVHSTDTVFSSQGERPPCDGHSPSGAMEGQGEIEAGGEEAGQEEKLTEEEVMSPDMGWLALDEFGADINCYGRQHEVYRNNCIWCAAQKDAEAYWKEVKESAPVVYMSLVGLLAEDADKGSLEDKEGMEKLLRILAWKLGEDA